MEDTLPEILGDRLMGKEFRHLEPRSAPQSAQGSLSESVLFIEIKSREHKVRRSGVRRQSCQALTDLMDCSLPDSLLHGLFPGKNIGVDCHLLLQGSCQPRNRTHVS